MAERTGTTGVQMRTVGPAAAFIADGAAASTNQESSGADAYFFGVEPVLSGEPFFAPASGGGALI
jgi:hypothetical protein